MRDAFFMPGRRNDAEYYAWFREQHPEPYFQFPAIEAIGELHFERLTPAIYPALFNLFTNDPSPFVDERFKDIVMAREYSEWLHNWGPYSPKHGSVDYLFSVEGIGYAGVLRLYDLSLEIFADHHKQVWIGFATNEFFRRKGIMGKAVHQVIKTVFNFYPDIDFVHTMTDKQNTFAQGFNLHCGFAFDPRERHSQTDRFYVLSRQNFSALL